MPEQRCFPLQNRPHPALALTMATPTVIASDPRDSPSAPRSYIIEHHEHVTFTCLPTQCFYRAPLQASHEFDVVKSGA